MYWKGGCIAGARDSHDRRAYSAPTAARTADATLTTTVALSASYERLTRDNTILLLIDHQIGPLWELEFARSRRRVAELAELARRLDVPIVVTTIAPETWGSVIPELAEVVDHDRVIVRRTVNAWEDPSIRSAVEATGRKKLVVAGSVAEVAVAVCALDAARAGYQVYAPIDASGQPSHRALERLSRAGVIVTTTSLIASELIGDGREARERAKQSEAAGVEPSSPGEALKRCVTQT